MKVILVHNARQHCHHTLQALEKRDVLYAFYTEFAANRYVKLLSFLPKKIQLLFGKRFFPNVPKSKIVHNPFIFLLEMWFRGNDEQISKFIYPKFDLWVSKQLKASTYNILIGYENINLHTFKRAKELGVITILDLAGIHHDQATEINSKFGLLDNGTYPDLSKWINQRKENALSYTDYILTLSTFAKEGVLEAGISPDSVYKVNLGVNLKNFSPKSAYPNTGKLRFLYVGTMTHRKGLELLLRTWSTINLSDVELVLIGPMADAEDALKQYSGIYTYHPFLHHEALAEEYRRADVFVFPSNHDSWAQTVIEAMACGTPVITTENTGAKDAVLQGGGLVIPAGDEEALKNSIRYFYENREQIEIMGRKARQIAEQYTWENYHQQVIAAIEDIARRENIPLS
jgi:glycosyltransferase involved in cell wall biosynthesis